MDDVRGALAANLAELRKEENLTQAEFAAQFNYSDKAVSKWERGDSLPDVVMLKTIADLYGLRVDDLLTDGGVAAAYAAATESGPPLGGGDDAAVRVFVPVRVEHDHGVLFSVPAV